MPAAIRDRPMVSVPAMRPARYDVLVAGGGSAGVAAAVGAAQAGAHTLLVEQGPYLGGAATRANVLTYCGLFTQADPPELAVAGVAAQVLERIRALGFATDFIRSRRTGNVVVVLDPEAVKFALDRLVTQPGLDVLLYARVSTSQQERGLITEVTCATPGEPVTVSAGAFVDATGDATLATLAGVPCLDIRGATMPGTLMIRIGGVGDLDPLPSPDEVAQAIRAERRRSGAHLAGDRVHLLRLPRSGDLLLSAADETVDGLNAHSLTGAEMSGRRQAWSYLDALRRGVRGFDKAHLVSTGPHLGIRQTRLVAGLAEVTDAHVREGRLCATSVARGAWPIERHPRPGQVSYESIRNAAHYHIPYDALRTVGPDNLWISGRALPSEAGAYSSLRVMGTAFATGHAAGVAAASWLARGGEHDVPDVLARLAKQGALL